MQFEVLEKRIYDWLEQELASTLHYHGLHHTQDVLSAATRIGIAVGVKEHELQLVQLAALFHDTGFVNQYKENEPVGADFARKILPEYGYEASDIEHVAAMILATRIPQAPQDHLAQILCDADLDYLGRDDFFIVAHSLRLEWDKYGIKFALTEWYNLQIQFLSKHKYFTSISQKLREGKKQEHLAEIQELMSVRA